MIRLPMLLLFAFILIISGLRKSGHLDLIRLTGPNLALDAYGGVYLSTDNHLSLQPKRRREATRLDDFVNNDMSDSASNDETIQGEYNKWMNQSRERKGEDPIEYWHSQRYNYPRLACFALDIFGVPAKSSEPERVFSIAGQLIRANRARLKPDIIGAALSLKSWDEMGAINWR